MKNLPLTRRHFLRHGARGFALFAMAGLGHAPIRADSNAPFQSLEQIGPLLPPDQNGLCLPNGFRSRIVARSGQPVVPGGAPWHPAPDGGACFDAGDGGWIYVSNSEIGNGGGGVGALRFNARGEVVGSYPILQHTSVNCAGGKTPWNTWLSCEEHDRGQVYECDPSGKLGAMLRPALGTFEHEAVAVDPVQGHLYLTEDKPDGVLYRFVPANGLPDLSAGVLEVAVVQTHNGRSMVQWKTLPDASARQQETRLQIPEATRFNGGEGIAFHQGRIYFTTKGDNRVWWLDTGTKEIGVLYDRLTSLNPILSGVDNVAITPAGDVLVAEDSGDMQIVVLTPSGNVLPLVQIMGHGRSEITGPAFDPAHQRLYFSSQRGSEGASEFGVTYEISRTGLA